MFAVKMWKRFMTRCLTGNRGVHLARATTMVFAVIVVFVWGVGERAEASERQSQAGESEGAGVHQAVLDRYCLTCHNDRMQTGSLTLEGVELGSLQDATEVWEKVLQKLQTRAMPPPGRPRPDENAYEGVSSFLEAGLDQLAEVAPNPGRPTIHRLNRLEYTNAIRDLIGLEVDGALLLPADDLAFGFDNNADLLTVAPGLLERYMSAARKISRLAIGDPGIDVDVVRYPLSSLLNQSDRMSEESPFGSRGGTAIEHHFPLDGEYLIRLKLQQNGGRNEPQEVDVRVDGARVGLLTVGRWPEESEALEGNNVSSLRNVAGRAAGGSDLAVRVPVRAGRRLVSVSLVQRNGVAEGVQPQRLPLWTFGSGRGYVEKMAIENIEVEGPYNPDTFGGGSGTEADTVTRRKIFVCRPNTVEEEEPCANEILRTLARRAFRRPVEARDVEALRYFFHEGRQAGGFETGVQRALERLLVDPEFLFRLERDPDDTTTQKVYQLSDVELASRLSFFLWSSIPDDELLELAEEGRLSQTSVLEEQVSRMLGDERASSLVESFASQWLHLRRMRSVAPDANAFPEFDENLRGAFIRETELFFQSQLRTDRSVVELLTSDYTFVNERLARHYGIPNIYGPRFRRVAVHEENRRGLLGHGSIHTVTSLATRTSPVIRGKWVLENILGAPPPPPPPDVPELPARADDGRMRSMRERMEEHRANPVCASCHSRMDPLGFAMQNFDAIGKWRDEEGGAVIDASGALPDGRRFDGLSELRDLLLLRSEEFVTTVTEKLLTYALGRGVEYYDRPAIRRIVRESESQDYRWSSIVAGVAKSTPFQMRSVDP